MKKNEIREGVVIGYGSEGEGVIKDDGFVVFIPFVLKGERVEYKVLKVDKTIVYAKLEKVLDPSVFRVKPGCLVFGKCGGCRLLHMAYSEQLVYKREYIENTLKKVAFCETVVEPCEPSVPEFRYRNKLQLPLRNVDGRNVTGFFAPDSHRIVETNDCLIQGEWCAPAITAIKKYAAECGVQFYNESTDSGLIKHLIVKKVGEWYLVCLVVNGERIPEYFVFVELLKRAFGTDKITLTLNVNRRASNAVLGEKTVVLYGDGVVYGSQFGVRYGVGTESFIQINDDVKAKLYAEAVLAACADSPSIVIDAYCGGGLMTALLAKSAAKVIGVEIVNEAVENAKILARENGLNNIEFICGACEDVLPDIVGSVGGNSVAVLDPPRKGVDKRLIEALLHSAVNKIVYVSCNPATLSRDVGMLTGKIFYEGNRLIRNQSSDGGNYFSVKRVKGFDMFAGCKGVEVLCVLERTQN